MIARQGKKKLAHPARPIKTKRDHKGASAAAARLAEQAAQDSEAERRLQALLHELDKFEVPEDETGDNQDYGYEQSGARRRWSDDVDDLDI